MSYFHLLHLNVLTNIRLKLATVAPCFCFCFWRPVNWLICKFEKFEGACRKICVDQCFKVHTVAKWIPYYIVFFLFRKRLIEYIEIIELYDTNLNWQKLALMKISVENVKWYLLVFVLHHWIFIGCRIALFLFIQIFCCGCQCIEDEANER